MAKPVVDEVDEFRARLAARINSPKPDWQVVLDNFLYQSLLLCGDEGEIRVRLSTPQWESVKRFLNPVDGTTYEGDEFSFESSLGIVVLQRDKV